MGWYGGQNGNIRRSGRAQITHSMERFSSSLEARTIMMDFTSERYVQDNYNFKVIPLLLCNEIRQDSLTRTINTYTGQNHSDLALAIAFTWYFKDFEGISDDVCENLTGLYLFSACNMDQKAVEDFIKRCPRIKSLTFASMDDITDKAFLCGLFMKGLLPQLKFVEVGHIDEDGIAAMSSSPDLREIVFRFKYAEINNAGFKRLVQNGGAQNLMKVTGTVDNKFGNSHTLTKNYLKAILPRFVSKECGSSALTGMDTGPEVKGPIVLRVQNISAPQHPAIAKRACQTVPERTAPQSSPNKPAAPGHPTISTMILLDPNMSVTSLISGSMKCVENSEAIAEKSGLGLALSLKEMKTKHEKTEIENVSKVVKRPLLGEIKYKTETSQQNIQDTLTINMTNPQPNYKILKVVQLKELLRKKGLKVTGNKATLVERLKGEPDYEDM